MGDRGRSRSRSVKDRGAKEDRNTEGGGASTIDGEPGEATTEVVDGVPRVNGDLTWQAQIYVPRSGVTHRPGQKPVTLCIRGPSRANKQDAESDGEKLLQA